MPFGDDDLVIKTASGIDAIAPSDWDACAGDDNPFCSHAFLRALEQSGAASRESGWMPHHLTVEIAATGRIVACLPLYLKSHSYGEYVFDWSWADAWEKAGGRYYPKLQCAIPFTPVTGSRLMIAPQARGLGLETMLGNAMRTIVQRGSLSSAHVTFPSQGEAEALAEQGWLLRMGEQYHWTNAGYRDFDDFLAALSSRRRKTIRKERERANGQGLIIETLNGAAITEQHWDAFYRCYLDTIDKKWAHAYLTRSFFSRLGEAMADKVVLVMAREGPHWVAGALNLKGRDALYGRNWGCLGHYPDLHFEMCYYRAIDYAIAHGLTRVEAGAQGEHKISRGYLPVPTWSAHWIEDPALRRAVANFLEVERREIALDISARTDEGPFRHCG